MHAKFAIICNELFNNIILTNDFLVVLAVILILKDFSTTDKWINNNKQNIDQVNLYSLHPIPDDILSIGLLSTFRLQHQKPTFESCKM